jgi:hypothetical protein
MMIAPAEKARGYHQLAVNKAATHQEPCRQLTHIGMRVSPMPTSLRRTRGPVARDAFEHGLGARRPHRGMIINEHPVP